MSPAGLVERGRDAVFHLLEASPPMKRETPKINGSFGGTSVKFHWISTIINSKSRLVFTYSGFIALVVCLALIIIVSCTAVFFLIRDQKAYDQQQAHRPYHRTATHPSSYLYNNNSAPKSWRTRFAMFGHRDTNANNQTRPDTSRVKIKGSGVHGWLQAGLEDDWEGDLVEERRQNLARLGVREVSAQNPPSVISVPSIVGALPVSRSNSDSTSSVRFDLSPVRGLANHDRHPSPHPTLPNIHSQISSPSSSPAPSPMRVRSPEPVPGRTALDSSRQLSSPPSVRTFPGGTKFIESL